MPTPTPTPTPIAPAPARLPAFLQQLTWPFIPARLESTLAAGERGPWLDGDDHYDEAWCLLAARDLARSLGLPAASAPWDDAIDAAFTRYAVNLVIPERGRVLGHHAYSPGAARLYLEAADRNAPRAAQALEVVRLLNPTGSRENFLDGWRAQDLSREIAFKLRNALAADRCGLGENPHVDTLAELALDHLDQWSRTPETRHWGTFCKPFMAALSMIALVDYHGYYSVASLAAPPGSPTPARRALLAAIPPAIARMCDWLWAHCWLPEAASFMYMDLDGPSSAPDIPGLVVRSATDAATFRGPDTLSAVDDYYTHSAVQFTAGSLALPVDRYRIVGYVGATREFRLQAGYHPPRPPVAGDTFTLVSLMERDGGTGPAPDLNHLVAPAFAWLYARTGEARWRERFDAAFDGGTMCAGPPSNQKQANQAWYALAMGLACRAAGVAVERAGGAGKPDVPPDEPTPVEPPVDPPPPDLEPGLLPRPRSFVAAADKPGRFRCDIARDGSFRAFWLPEASMSMSGADSDPTPTPPAS